MIGKIASFVAARLDDDEAIARAATPAPWWHNPGKVWLGAEAFEAYDRTKGEEFVGYGESPFSGCVAATGPGNHPQSMRDAEHIARHDPARALREVEFKRTLLAQHLPVVDGSQNSWTWFEGSESASEKVLRDMATVWAGHPDYDPAWRP